MRHVTDDFIEVLRYAPKSDEGLLVCRALHLARAEGWVKPPKCFGYFELFVDSRALALLIRPDEAMGYSAVTHFDLGYSSSAVRLVLPDGETTYVTVDAPTEPLALALAFLLAHSALRA
jgi:hypothetical protein